MSDWINRVHFGDCLETLRRMPDGIVNTCVTSPPYFGLRDYGHAGQIGLEETPEQFIAKLVEVFREVRRVLRDDGTAWVNMGDSYCNTDKWGGGKNGNTGKQTVADDGTVPSWQRQRRAVIEGVKPKDLIGVPWALAKALRDPYYAGTIKSELDRVWLAAMMDGEGTISGFYHDRPNGEGVRTGVNVCLTNTCFLILNRAAAIWPASLLPHEQNNDRLGNKPVFRWKPSGAENTGDFLAELYPYLMTKKRQAMLAWNLMQFSKDGQKWGKSAQAEEVRGKRAELVRLMTGLNQGESVIIPEWVKEPPSLYEPGWYLRQEVIWNKPNPMPESVTDRCTKSHESLFLLAKSPTYYCDMAAIREPVAQSTVARMAQDVESQQGSFRVPGKTNGPMKAVGRSRRDSFKREDSKRAEVIPGQTVGTHREDRDESDYPLDERNKRSVWTVATKSYKGAHFATYPTELIEPCILAGAPAGGVVLDPFFGSGTTGEVAQNLGRNWIGCELNPAYKPLQDERLRQPGLILEAA